MEWAIGQVLTLIGLGIILLLAAAVVSPLESLGWWAGWSGKKLALADIESTRAGDRSAEEKPPPEKECFVLYLSGIGVAANNVLAFDETDFVNRLQEALPRAEIITDVFPYSVTNNPLTGDRLLRPIYQKIHQIQTENPASPIALIAINFRNMLQTAVSADPRYGPIYSLGVAHEIVRSLARHGYRLGSGKPVHLIGYSGGAQIGIGCAPYLSPLIQAPVYMLSVGGVISNDPGIHHVQHVTHLFGANDFIQKIGEIVWAGRWPIMKQSNWNRAVAAGKVDLIEIGPMGHNGRGGYYDAEADLPDGRDYCQATTDAIREAVVSTTA